MQTGFDRFGVMLPAFEGDGGGGGTGVEDKVTLSNAELEKLIEGRVSSAVALATKKAGQGGVSEAEKAELETLRKEREERDRKEKEARGQYDAALKSQEESIRKEYEPKLTEFETRAKAAHEKLEEKVVGVAVSDAAGRLNAVNPAQVRLLLARDFKMNDQYEAIVLDEQGNQRFLAGKPMTPEQRVKEYLDQNPHLVRSNGATGGGAGGGRTIATGDASAIAEAEAKVKALEAEVQATGSSRAITAHRKAFDELTALKRKGAA